MTQVYDHELAGVGLSLNQYSILRRTEREPRALGGLAEELGMDRTTLTRNLSPLVDAGLLETVRGEDARQRLVALTTEGRALVAAGQTDAQALASLGNRAPDLAQHAATVAARLIAAELATSGG